MTGDKDHIRRSRMMLEDALRQAGAVIKGSTVRCPFHDDKSPSASIHLDADGTWRFTCHTCKVGGDYFDVQALITGKTVEELLKAINDPSEPNRAPAAKAIFKSLGDLSDFYVRKGLKIESTFRYGRPGDVKLIVLRCLDADGRKTFKQAHPCDDGYAIGKPAGPMPLYGIVVVEQAHSVLVVEGEKACHAVKPYLPEGWAVTTSSGGAERADGSDWSCLSGKSRVVLFPDADEPDPKTGKIVGKAHMEQVKGLILGLKEPPALAWIDSWNLELPPKGDVVEYLATYEDDAAKTKGIQGLLASAQSQGDFQDMLDFADQATSGKFRSEPWPWPELTRLTQSLIPGMVTAICGDPGCGKSFMIIQAITHWYMQGIRCAVFELEDNKNFHIRRALSQVVGNSGLTDLIWMERPENHHALYQTLGQWEDFITGIGRCIFTAAGGKQQTYAELVKWAKDRAEAGCRIIVIDPITMAKHVTPAIWEEDTTFINDIKDIAREYNVSIILVTHPKKGTKNGILDDLAGGAAFARFSHTVLWVVRHDEKEEVMALGANGIRLVSINRTVQIRKARNGHGAGRDIAFNFSIAALRFEEEGMISKKHEAQEDTQAESAASVPDIPF